MRFLKWGGGVIFLMTLLCALSANVCQAQWVPQGLSYDPKVSTIQKSGSGFIAIINGGSTAGIITGSNGPTVAAVVVKLTLVQNYNWTGAVGASPAVTIKGTATFSGSFAVPGSVPTGQIDFWTFVQHSLTSFTNNGNNYTVDVKYSPVGFLVAGSPKGSCSVDVSSLYSQGAQGTGQQELDISITP